MIYLFFYRKCCAVAKLALVLGLSVLLLNYEVIR